MDKYGESIIDITKLKWKLSNIISVLLNINDNDKSLR